MVDERESEYQEALAVSDIFQVLSLFLRLPSRELSVGLLDGGISEDVTAILRELGHHHEETLVIENTLQAIQSSQVNVDTFHSQLRQEYTRLFSHPRRPQIAIYETLFRYKVDEDGEYPPLFISPAALDAERCYKKAGLAMSSEVNESGDHMSIEMEFMMYLFLEKAISIREGDEQGLARRNLEIQEFTRLHLNRWGQEFFEKCKNTSQIPVYKVIGEIGVLVLSDLARQDVTACINEAPIPCARPCP